MILVHYEKLGLSNFRQGDRVFGSLEELEDAFPAPKFQLVEKPLTGRALELYLSEKSRKPE